MSAAQPCLSRRFEFQTGLIVIDWKQGADMTEQEWLECADPTALLSCLAGKTSERKLRLFCVGCCRQIWKLIIDKKKQQAVIAVEEYADSKTTNSGLRAIAQLFPDTDEALGCDEYAVAYATLPFSYPDIDFEASQSPLFCADYAAKAQGEFAVPAFDAISETADGNDPSVHALGMKVISVEKIAQAYLFRCIFGNPFRPITIDPRWLTSTVVDLAQAIYEERAFDRMPILADALMDAGCDTEEIIAHCRSDGPHVRGCWVVDLILGKE
jgi:hypothetical protein